MTPESPGLVIGIALLVVSLLVLLGAFLWAVRQLAHERQASRELRRLYAFGRELLEARLDIDAMCRLVEEYCQEIVPAAAFALVLREPSGAVYCPLASHSGQPLSLREADAAAALALVEQNGEAVLLPGEHEPPTPLPLAIADATASGLYVPIYANDTLLGVIALQSDQVGAFTREHLADVTALASQAALGLQAAALLRQQQQRTAQLMLIAEVGRKVAAILDLQTLFHDTVHLVQETFGYYHVSIYRLSDDNKTLILTASSDAEIEHRGLTVPLGVGLIGHAAQEGRIHLANDVLHNDLYLHEASLDRTRAELAIPLRVENRILGVLDLQSDRAQAFTDDDASVLQVLADQIAVAIEDSHLYMLQRQQSRISEALLQVANVLSSATSLSESMAAVVDLTPRLVEVTWCLAVVWPDDERRPLLHTTGLPTEVGAEISRELARRSREQITACWGSQKHLVVEAPDDMAALCSVLAEHTPFVVIPLAARENVVGYLLAGAERAEALSGQAANLLADIARQASLAIDSALLHQQILRQQQFEQEMHLARDIQLSFMPESLPDLPGWDIAVEWKAARGVGGDFYDLIPLDENRLGIVIADVSDKGVAAALYMALSRTVMRSTALEGYSAARTLQRTNTLLLPESRSGMFVTMFYAILDLRSGLLRYARAGHNPPLLLRASTLDIETLCSPGIVLGVVDDPEIEQRTTMLYPGDVLLLYTDGVTEATSPDGDEFGVEGLENTLRQSAGLSAEQVIRATVQAQAAFVEGSEQADDFTLLVVRRQPIIQDTATGAM